MTDPVAVELVEANERMGDALVQIGLALGLPCPTAQDTWGAPEILARIADLRAQGAPSTAQPPPQPVPGARSVHDMVIEDLPAESLLGAMLRERKAFGLAKYGCHLAVAEPGRDATQDLIEELGDAVVYARRAAEQGIPGARGAYFSLIEVASAACKLWYRPPAAS